MTPNTQPKLADLRSEGRSLLAESLASAPVNMSLLTLDRADGGRCRWVGDLAEVQHAGCRVVRQLYSDAADVGFASFSPWTGAMAVWSLVREEGRDGELIAYHYAPTAATVRRVPALEGATVSLFND